MTKTDFYIAKSYSEEAKKTSVNSLSKKLGKSRGGIIKIIERYDETKAFTENMVKECNVPEIETVKELLHSHFYYTLDDYSVVHRKNISKFFEKTWSVLKRGIGS